MNRSRVETRVTRVYQLDDPVQLGLFGAHTLVRTWRKTEFLAGKRKGLTTEDVSYHASSVRIDALHGAEFFGDSVRGEWSVEKYHARRDGTYCEDIRTRRCDENVTGALMLARTLALYFFARSGMSNCQAFKEHIQANPTRAFNLVMRKEKT